MARALTRVSRDYNWTIKRADNDLHDAINPRLQSSSPSSPDIRSVDLSVFPWDSNRLRWKFRTEYEELREHLEHSFFILLSWAATIDYILRVAIGHFIRHLTQSVVRFYEESVKFSCLDIPFVSMWGLLGFLFHSAAPRLVSCLWGTFFGFPLRPDEKSSTRGKADAGSASRLTRQPVSSEVPAKGPKVSSGTQVPAKDDTDSVTNDPALSPSNASLTNDLQDVTETIHTV
ncbi:hypothetical protein BJV74DRAFT_824132 [Russula compacta]|nr:hypothetical protein BJV74DRAFT_824132 [Russula compacta]